MKNKVTQFLKFMIEKEPIMLLIVALFITSGVSLVFGVKDVPTHALVIAFMLMFFDTWANAKMAKLNSELSVDIAKLFLDLMKTISEVEIRTKMKKDQEAQSEPKSTQI